MSLICNVFTKIGIKNDIIWFLIIRFQEENFRESINAEPKLGKKLIRGSSIYFAKNSRVDKGYLSKQKF